jgi:hypothetical protein
MYAVPLVYSVSFRGKLVVDPDAGADADDELPLAVLVLLLDGEPVQALAAASVSTAMAAVPYLERRHRLPVGPCVGLTCSYLLASKSSDNPGAGTSGHGSVECRDGTPPAAQRPFRVFVRSRRGNIVAGQVTRPPRRRR